MQNLTHKSDESFIRYAQRWRELVAHIQPPLVDKELVHMFMDTLQGLYSKRMVDIASLGFSDHVKVGERIESSLKSKKI